MAEQMVFTVNIVAVAQPSAQIILIPMLQHLPNAESALVVI
jgi:hypothetical protein